MPITFVGPRCARRGCRYPVWKDLLCGRCWRLAQFIGKDPGLFAYEPLDAYTDDRDTVPLPWEQWEGDARARGLGIADMLAERPTTGRPTTDRTDDRGPPPRPT